MPILFILLLFVGGGFIYEVIRTRSGDRFRR